MNITVTPSVAFAQERVNLPKEKADEYRAQARRLRDRLETYLTEHPDFTLRKMLLSGSLAKGVDIEAGAAKRDRDTVGLRLHLVGTEVGEGLAQALGEVFEQHCTTIPAGTLTCGLAADSARVKAGETDTDEIDVRDWLGGEQQARERGGDRPRQLRQMSHHPFVAGYRARGSR